MMARQHFWAWGWLFLWGGDVWGSTPYNDGDIIFQTSVSSQSRAIQKATHSPYSHMGILFRDKGQWFVWEAEARVTQTPLAQWIRRGVGGKYVVKRVRGMNPEKSALLREKARSFDGKPYDPYFEWSDNRIYCSELVWKIYFGALGVEIGKRKTLKDFDLSSMEVRTKLKERFGDHIPWQEPVISPADMLESDQLVQIGVP